MIRWSDRQIRWNAFILASLLATLIACGGGNGGGGNNDGGNTPPPGGGTAQNPCATVSLEADVQEPDTGRSGFTGAGPRKNGPDPGGRWRVLDAIWAHRAARLRGQSIVAAPPSHTVDVGDIAVLQDQGDLALTANRFDLQGSGLRFTRNAAGGYDVQRIDATFRQPLGNALTLSDDDSAQATVPFGFSFYGRSQTRAFVNSDGNVTFEEADSASTERNIARLLTGPPRVAPFLADLDPSAGGRVFANAAASQFTVTWCNVRGFESSQTATVQATMLPDGSVEMKFAEGISLDDAIVGISPGRTSSFHPDDLTAGSSSPDSNTAVGERFSATSQLDIVAVAQTFYRSHPDLFDQLVVWTDAPLLRRGAFAVETSVANEVSGIGLDLFDLSRDFGSGGRLRSMVNMDNLAKYPDNPVDPVPGIRPNTTVSVLGQEVGHRWLAFLRFRAPNGTTSDDLLGRDRSHWSFFFDSDASVMEGNDIEDLGGGSFRTTAVVQRYSLLDQYAMGLVSEAEVPSFFFVESPTNMSAVRQREDAPEVGITFNGTRRGVLIQDVVAALGPRRPTSAESARVHRQAFVYVVSRGQTAQPAAIEKMDRIRRQWETFFLEATARRMRAETTLQPPS
jgi:hypothetical protein